MPRETKAQRERRQLDRVYRRWDATYVSAGLVTGVPLRWAGGHWALPWAFGFAAAAGLAFANEIRMFCRQARLRARPQVRR